MRRDLLNRHGAVPRSALYLAAVLVVAVAVLFLLRRDPAPPDYTLGGELFTAGPGQVTGLVLTRDGVQYRLDRTDGGHWALTGAISDFLDQNAVQQLLQDLTAATGGRLLAGSVPEDRRYEFNGPGAMRLSLLRRDGETESLAIGARNPVTGAFYGSGAGRNACFPVSPGLRDRLAQVPDRLRLSTLLPAFDLDTVVKVELWRGSAPYVLEKRAGRWWLQLPAAGEAVLGPWYRDYTALYDDRRRTDPEGRTWLLAHDQAVRLIMYDSSRVIVKQLVPAGYAPQLDTDLTGPDPWRRVRLTGPGINPDPTLGPDDTLELAFGAPLSEDRVPILRQGNLLLAEPEAVTTISEPVSHLLDSSALGLSAAVADSLVLTREGEVLLRAHRDTAGARPAERFKERPVDFWLTDFMAQDPADMSDRSRHGRSRNLLTNLDRTGILRVFPPSADPAVLQDRERITLTLHFAEGPDVPGMGRGTLTVHIGYLAAEHLPAGSPEPVRHLEDDLPAVGLWLPETGQLVQIPGHVIVTARNWAN